MLFWLVIEYLFNVSSVFLEGVSSLVCQLQCSVGLLVYELLLHQNLACVLQFAHVRGG